MGWLPKSFKLDGYTALRSHGDREKVKRGEYFEWDRF
jgi:hypothetical protein